MAETKIEWTEATWNPMRGCSPVSEGCRNCYAERIAARFADRWAGPPTLYGDTPDSDTRFARMTEDGSRWTGRVQLIPEKLDEPFRWRKPRMVFVTSMSDPFHEKLSDEDRDRIFAVIAMCPQHTFQSLTKRPENQRRYFSDPETPFRIQRAMDAIGVDQDMRGVKEKWRIVVGWIKYEVSNYGNVRRGGKLLAQAAHSRGYRQVALCESGKAKTRLVHVLVLEAFHGPQGDSEVRHRNGNRTDNRLANLSWGSRADNMQDAARHGTAGAWMKGRSTLTPEQVGEIRTRRAAGEKLDNIAAAIGSTRKQISAVALGKMFKPAAVEWPLPNLWLGVSVEDQETADERIPLLLQTPAALRFVSLEPMLAPVTLDPYWLHVNETGVPPLDWVIVGGESGPGARLCNVEWIYDVMRQCRRARVPVFVKQLGANCGFASDRPDREWFQGRSSRSAEEAGYEGVRRLKHPKGGDPAEWPEDLRVREWPT